MRLGETAPPVKALPSDDSFGIPCRPEGESPRGAARSLRAHVAPGRLAVRTTFAEPRTPPLSPDGAQGGGWRVRDSSRWNADPPPHAPSLCSSRLATWGGGARARGARRRGRELEARRVRNTSTLVRGRGEARRDAITAAEGARVLHGVARGARAAT